MAVPTTDLIQSIVMSIALVIIVFFGIHVAGGWDAVTDNARSLAGYLSMTHVHNMADNTASPYGFITILSTLAWGLGYFGMPHILLRFMAISHEDKLKTSRRIASIWVVISMFVAILIGIIGYGASVAGGIPMFSSIRDRYHPSGGFAGTPRNPAVCCGRSGSGRNPGLYHVHG